MKKGLVSILLSTTLVFSALTGCGSTGSGSSASENTDTETSTEAESVAEESTDETTEESTEEATEDTAATGELTPITVLGEYDPQVSGQQIVAKEMGFFEEEGLDVDLQLLTEPSISTAMVASGEAQFYSISNGQAIKLVEMGSEVCIIAPVINASNTQVVVGRGDLEITSAKDLEGLKMGYTDGADIIIAVKNMCKDLGVDYDAIELVNLQAADMLASLEKGDIDFFAAWEPWGIEAEKNGGKVLFTGSKSYLPDNEGDVNYLTFEMGIDVSKSYLESNPEECKAYVRAMMKATDYINENLEEAAAIIAPVINLDTETCVEIMKKNVYTVQFDQTYYDSVGMMSSYMLESGMITKEVKFEDFTDTSILEAIDPSRVNYTAE